MKSQLKTTLALSSAVTAVMLFVLVALAPSAHAAFTIKVISNDRSTTPATRAPLSDYKWLVQEDNTFDAVGNVGKFNSTDSLSVSIHKSNAKVLASGTGANPVVNLPPGRYFVSVQAGNHYNVGGSPVRAEDDGGSVTVVINKFPVPLAQITVLVFNDNAPINGAWDTVENLLGDFRVYLFDQLGQQSQDAFGNPIGTTYNVNPDGTPVVDANGNASIKSKGPGYVLSKSTLIDTTFNYNAVVPNLSPGKYGIWVQPSDGRPWVQTSTIEGTPGIDNWVLAGEPNFFTETGFFGVHSFIGFVLPSDYPGDAVYPKTQFATTGTGVVTGQVVQNRIFRPPLQMGLNPGDPVPTAYIGLSDNNAANQSVFVMGCPGQVTSGPATGSSCDANARFTINGVPPGTYTLTMWDYPLDQIIDFRTIVVPPAAAGPTPVAVPVENCPTNSATYPFCPSIVFQWFGNLEGCVAVPGNDCSSGKTGLPNEVINLRLRDGSLYQTTTSNTDGTYNFPEVFPFFKWIVVESDPADMKPMGATVKVDKGGPFANTTWDPTGNNNVIPLLEQRTDPAGTMTEAMILYMDNTNVIDWSKRPYGTDETGYIFGMVSYAFTRTPLNPANATQSPWEPGIPDVEMRLYKVTGYDTAGKPLFDRTAPVATTLSDSWNKNYPTGCLDAMKKAGIDINSGGIPLDSYIDCSETMPIWNQIKPGVFDGTYLFDRDAQGNPLPAGDYVVEAVAPNGYEVIKEEDQNFILAGPVFPDINPSLPQPAALKRLQRLMQLKKPNPAVTPPACVGPDHTIPAFMTYDGTTPVPNAGQVTPLCTMKLVHLQPAQNFNADFRFFTQVPLAARIIGLVTDDLALEFRAGNPRLGDKIGPSFMPVSFQDYAGNELARTYTDEWGQYNSLIPATFWTNTPNPTGVSPNIVNIVLNPPYKADPITRQLDPKRPEPWWKPGYPTAPFPMDVWAGKITYADTPMVPLRPGVDTVAIDCSLPDGTPVINQVNGPAGGPWVETPSATSLITISSGGLVQTGNLDPTFGGTLTKNYGFGTAGDVFVTPAGSQFGSANTKKLQVVTWTDAAVVANGLTLNADGTPGAALPSGVYQLTVRRADNHKMADIGITLHVGLPAAQVRKVIPGQLIQDAIDAANSGDLILVAPGAYPENLILWKPVRLQGYGAYATTIDAGAFTPDKQAAWTAKQTAITATGPANNWLIDAQQPDYFLETGAAVYVLAPTVQTSVTLPGGTAITVNTFGPGVNQAMIDGFTLTRANLGGGVNVHANAHYLQISNNKFVSNNGTFGGGIRIGTPTAVSNTVATLYATSNNDNVRILNNEISFNGGTGFNNGSGGGIALFKGTDNYVVGNNWICGNYASLGGAGIAQQGLSNNGLIENNTILFNESFDEGAGIFLSGETPITVAGITEGVGSVVINANLLQGNKAGNLGGAIGILRFNGQDVQANPDNTLAAKWYKAEIYNNMIVNNLSASFGGGIAISDALDVTIAGNTIANNDSTGTGEVALGAVPVNVDGADAVYNLPQGAQSTPMAAGIGVQPLSTTLLNVMTDAATKAKYLNRYDTNPVIVNDIIYGNLSYYWAGFDQNVNAGVTTPPKYAIWDLGVFGDPAGATGLLNPQYSLLTRQNDPAFSFPGGRSVKPYPFNSAAPTGNNVVGDPKLVSTYRNTINATQGGAAIGNFISFNYSPISLAGNYHINAASPARGAGSVGAPVFSWNSTYLDLDFDGDSRAAPVDVGADYYNAKGDVNGDGVVNIFDVLIALQMATGNYPAAQVTAGMLNNVHVAPLSVTGRPAGGVAQYNPPAIDTVSVADALLILQRAVGVVFW
ncbi:hypothetical protein F6V25_12775 [Oryzomonas japonica]|uniref:Probable pectate lyase C n=1 Tax=Oryzomonas japonica TaxID=2603858 RepID=A0A7J4ZNM8_9BACT|nr:hypothetical protein [Oryzomonas japonica]KAB0664409.1 hypothetical protein F6V25_12775 [Oryzomonas japonica]